MKVSVLRRPMQVASFVHKEVVDVLRQPKLLLTLVIGPFLILAGFGVGYSNTPPKLRTLFVAPKGSPLLREAPTYANQVNAYVHYSGVTSDEGSARRQLAKNKVDLLVIFPADPLHSVLGGRHATLTVVHTRLDPIEQTAISFASQLGTNAMNAQLVGQAVGRGQQALRPATAIIEETRRMAGALDQAVTSGDQQAIARAVDDVATNVTQLGSALRVSTMFTRSLSSDAAVRAPAERIDSSVQQMQRVVSAMRRDAVSGNVDADARQLHALVDTLSAQYRTYTNIPPALLAEPFDSVVDLAVPGGNRLTDWYAPAAIVLMMQQFGVAFGALSFVRERQLGIVEVLQVAPVGATESLLGKYLAYLAVGGVTGALLTGLVVAVLHVPLGNSVGDIALVMGLSLFASIGLGLVISLGSRDDAQAVQYALLVLLASLFFSGFFLSLAQLVGVARYAGWLLPVTYGMRLLRDVMLRGAPPDRALVAALALYGTLTFVLAMLGARRRLSNSR